MYHEEDQGVSECLHAISPVIWQARAALASVVDLAPQTAVLSEGGCRVRVEDVKVGSLLAVKAGEIIPIDGEVVSGKSSVDESSVTGESMPVEKEVGATVWAGTLNMSGVHSRIVPGMGAL
jgi:Cd2+/Zn2+-exporting ATPase